MSVPGVAAGARLVLATRAMATRFELVLAGEDELLLRTAGEEALREIEAQERALSLFDRASLLSHIHRAAGREWVRLDADTFELFALCNEVHRASGGAFDPTVGARMRQLGFHDGEREVPGSVLPDSLRCSTSSCATSESGGTVPGSVLSPASRLESLPTAVIGWRQVELDAARSSVRLADADLRLDFGGVAKGHALDLAARILRRAGITTAFLQGGTSSALALGAPPDRDGWLVALGAAPDAPCALLRDGALSVSAQHGRVLDDGATHVLDPRTGTSARGPTHAAVIASTAAFADAWSTALLVSGELPAREGVETLVAHGPPDAPGWRQCPHVDELARRQSAPSRRFLSRPPIPRS